MAVDLSIFVPVSTPLDLGVKFAVFNGGGTIAPLTMTVSATPVSLLLSFSAEIEVIAPASGKEAWRVEDADGTSLGVNSISIGTTSITINTNEHTNGANYILTVPSGIQTTTTPPVAFAGPYIQTYAGVGTPPTVLNAVALTYNVVRITFDEPVIEAEALVNTNYAIDNGAFVTRVTKVTDSIYDLSTSPLNSGVSYTVTASNIHDLAHNPI